MSAACPARRSPTRPRALWARSRRSTPPTATRCGSRSRCPPAWPRSARCSSPWRGSRTRTASCDRKLRDYYGIDTGDQELRADNKSYATLVHEEGGEAQRVENVDELETPNADTRTDESQERLKDPGSAEMRKVTAEDVTHNTQKSGDDAEERDTDQDDDEGEDAGR